MIPIQIRPTPSIEPITENKGLKNPSGKTREQLKSIIELHRSGNENDFIEAIEGLGKLDLVYLMHVWQSDYGTDTHKVYNFVESALIQSLPF